MTPRNKILVCLIGNVIILSVIVIIVSVFATQSTYWRFGWSDNLIVISVRINTLQRYIGLLFGIMVINVSRVIVEEIGMPILGFSVYNPDKKVITDFGKNELQFYANAMFMVSGLRSLFMTVISVTQFDIALWSLVISEITCIYTIRLLLNEKEFPNVFNKLEELENVVVN